MEPRTYLAEVEFFFQVEYGFEDDGDGDGDGERRPKTHYLAYVRHMPVRKETFDSDDVPAVALAMTESAPDSEAYARTSLFRLTKGVGVGAHEVIACQDIEGLAGCV